MIQSSHFTRSGLVATVLFLTCLVPQPIHGQSALEKAEIANVSSPGVREGVVREAEHDETSRRRSVLRRDSVLIWADEFNDSSIDEESWEHMIGDGIAYGLPPGWGAAASALPV